MASAVERPAWCAASQRVARAEINMTKYEIIRAAIEEVVDAGAKIHWNRSEMLFALMVTTVENFAAESGNTAVADILEFELQSLREQVDTVFLRAR